MSKVYEKCQALVSEKTSIIFPDDFCSSSNIIEFYKDKSVVLDLATEDAESSMGFTESETNMSNKIEEIIAQKEKEN